MNTVNLSASDFPSMLACADAAHLLAVTTGALVKIFSCGPYGMYAEFFGHGVRCEEISYEPYFSGYIS